MPMPDGGLESIRRPAPAHGSTEERKCIASDYAEAARLMCEAVILCRYRGIDAMKLLVLVTPQHPTPPTEG